MLCQSFTKSLDNYFFFLKCTIQLSINYLSLSSCSFRVFYHTLGGKILEFITAIISKHGLLNSEKMPVFNFKCSQSAINTIKTNIYQLPSHIQAESWKGRRNNSPNVLLHFRCYHLIPVPCFQCFLSSSQCWSFLTAVQCLLFQLLEFIFHSEQSISHSKGRKNLVPFQRQLTPVTQPIFT